MGYPITKYKTSISASNSADNSRSLSAVLWRAANEQYASDNPNIGTFLYDDFLEAKVNTVGAFSDGWWLEEEGASGATAEAFDSGTNAVSPFAVGIANLAATTGTDWQGVKVHRGGSATTAGRAIRTPKHTTQPQGDVIYETRVFLNTQQNDTFFLGLAEADADLFDATGGLVADADYVGFYRTDAAGLVFVCRNDVNGGTAVSHSSTIIATADVPEDAWVKLGFRINQDFSVEISVNGQIIKKDTSGVDIRVSPLAIPIESLTETKAVIRGATGDNATVALATDFDATFVAP